MEICQHLSSRRVSPFLAWVDFHARSRFARSTIPEEKWGTTRSLVKGHRMVQLQTVKTARHTSLDSTSKPLLVS